MKMWKTNRRFVISKEYLLEISEKDLQQNSTMWNRQVGDYVKVIDKESKKTFKGKVIGYNNFPQKGRIIFIETSPGRMVYIDVYDNLKDITNRKKSHN